MSDKQDAGFGSLRMGSKSPNLANMDQIQEQKSECEEEEHHHSSENEIDPFKNELDPKNMELINDLIHGMGLIGAGKGMERAEAIIDKKILKGEKKVTLEALDL